MSFNRPKFSPQQAFVNPHTVFPEAQPVYVAPQAPQSAYVRAPMPEATFFPNVAPAPAQPLSGPFLPTFGRQQLANPFADLMRFLPPAAFTGTPLVGQAQPQPDPIQLRAQQMLDAGAQMHPDANTVGYGRRRGDMQGQNIDFQYARDNPLPAPPVMTPGVSPDGTGGPQVGRLGAGRRQPSTVG